MIIIILLFIIVFLYLLTLINETFKNTSNKYYLINVKGYFKDNMKAWDLYKYFNNEDLFTVLTLDLQETKNFFTNNNNKVILLNDNRKAHNELILHASKLNNNKYVFIFGDWWTSHIGYDREYNNNIIKLVNSNTKKNIEYFLNFKLKRNYVRIFNPWSCYDKSFVCFNKNPINKILVSGRGVNEEIEFYPDRFKLSKFNKYQISLKKFNKNYVKSLSKEYLTNDYSTYLNKYICCFASSTYRYNYTEKKIVNTNCILLKNFEILATGSLLLNPLIEKPYLEKIGLIEDVNCMFIDMSDDKKIKDKIDFILNARNRKFIDKVRKAGQDHGRKNLNSKKKYEELKNIILKL